MGAQTSGPFEEKTPVKNAFLSIVVFWLNHLFTYIWAKPCIYMIPKRGYFINKIVCEKLLSFCFKTHKKSVIFIRKSKMPPNCDFTTKTYFWTPRYIILEIKKLLMWLFSNPWDQFFTLLRWVSRPPGPLKNINPNSNFLARTALH